MLLSEMQSKDIINLIDGKKVGSIIDVEIGTNGNIISFKVQKRKFLFFSSSPFDVKWSDIDKIGKDVILVNVKS